MLKTMKKNQRACTLHTFLGIFYIYITLYNYLILFADAIGICENYPLTDWDSLVVVALRAGENSYELEMGYACTTIVREAIEM